MTTRLLTGDCLERMRELADESIAAVVCDPPYALPGGFMGKTWDQHDGREDAALAYYLCGLIDGEGHFAIKQHTRGTHAPAFALKIRRDEEGGLRQIVRAVGFGSISVERRSEANDMVKWSVQSKEDCQRLVDLLDKYGLRLKKRLDYALWREAVCEWTSRPRGNRWHGSVSNERMADLRARLMESRRYVDPPWSGYEFQDWTRLWATEAFRVLKPGGHLLAFGGTRTYHRLATGVEDAGFEIRDCLAWMFGSGFPKSLDVSKAIDKAKGVEGEYGEPKTARHAEYLKSGYGTGKHEGWDRPWMDDDEAVERTAREYLPGSEEAARWKGWGTALKPAFEPIVLARKPFVGTVAANVLANGVGGLNVDTCRVGGGFENPSAGQGAGREAANAGAPAYGVGLGGVVAEPHSLGRWPANVLLGHSPECVPLGTREVASDGHYPSARPSGVEIGTVGHAGQDGLEERHTRGETVEVWKCADDCPVRLLDEQAGDAGAFAPVRGSEPSDAFSGVAYGEMGRAPGVFYGDRGGPSRFFYCAKTSRAERNAGLEDFDEQESVGSASFGLPDPRMTTEQRRLPSRNSHPTVKPIAVMRWLLRLVVPAGGTILDPFVGSGSTGCAAALEGLDFVGVELDPEYVRIAEARIRFWSEHGEDGLRVVAERAVGERARVERRDAGQLDLLGDIA